MYSQGNIKHQFSSQINYMFRPNIGRHQADHEEEKNNTYRHWDLNILHKLLHKKYK